MSVLFPVLVLLLGCPRKAPPPGVEPPIVIEVPLPAPAAPVGREVASGPWTDAAGILALEVPAGWSGREGPPGSSLVLTLVHDESKVEVQLWEYPGSGQVEPRPRPGCDWMFTDEGRHRLVPALTPAVTATCVGDDPRAPVVQGWYGRVRGREVHVEVVYPAGRVIEGRLAVEPLLAALNAA